MSSVYKTHGKEHNFKFLSLCRFRYPTFNSCFHSLKDSKFLCKTSTKYYFYMLSIDFLFFFPFSLSFSLSLHFKL